MRFKSDKRVEQIVVCSPDKDLAQLVSGKRIVCWDRRRDILAKMNAYALAGRYPDSVPARVTADDARDRLAEAKQVFEWLMEQLPR